MTGPSALTGESSNHKLAAAFADPGAARAAAGELAAALSLEPAQVQVILPGEPHPGRKLEPESHGIWRTIVIAHARLGLAGAAVGVLGFAALYAMGVPFIVSSPVAAGLVMLFFGAVAGLMLGGLVALRPDHDRYVQATRDAMAAGETTVVVHAFSAAQRDQAEQWLVARGGRSTSTL